MLTLAPERYTAGLCMVTKVIPWYIWNHCIADSIDLHNGTADGFLRKLARYMWNYNVGKYRIIAFQNIENEKYLSDLMKWHPCEPKKKWPLIACNFYCFTYIQLSVPWYCNWMVKFLFFKFHVESIYDPKLYSLVITCWHWITYRKKMCVSRFIISARRKGLKNVFLTYFL